MSTRNKAIKRIAMWSGPRNISTAMMRAWENRADTAVVDEPFYACYLHHTGIVHPMQEEVLASQSTDWQTVIKNVLEGDLAAPQFIQYQKHMTQHMVSEIDRSWFSSLNHAFLIRHPAQVIKSYSEKRAATSGDELGFKRQKELYVMACDLGDKEPPILDAAHVLSNPELALSKLCEQLEVPFDQNMLSWPPGRRESDGAWAPHWYQNVEKSTGFGSYTPKDPVLTPQEQRLVDQCLPYYHYLLERC